jgi:RimJ/RimL family protein N-acetyltransferase
VRVFIPRANRGAGKNLVPNRPRTGSPISLVRVAGIVIEGERIRLRKVEKPDLPLLHKWGNDRDVVAWARFSPEHMTSLAALEKAYEKELHDEETERVSFMIEERATSRAIGWCVVRTWDRKHVSANVGISLGEKELWGKGYGTEAMELLLEIVFDHQGWHHAELWTLAENERAIKSFEKSGFRRVGVEREVAYFSGGYHDVVLMEQLKAEWDARKGA